MNYSIRISLICSATTRNLNNSNECFSAVDIRIIESRLHTFLYENFIHYLRNGAKISSVKSDKETKKATVRLLRLVCLCLWQNIFTVSFMNVFKNQGSKIYNKMSPNITVSILVHHLLSLRTIVLLSQTLGPLPG